MVEEEKKDLADLLWDQIGEDHFALDVNIVTKGGEVVKAHRAMLAFRFPPLARAFKTVPAELDVTIIAKDFDKDTVVADLKQIYFCKVGTIVIMVEGSFSRRQGHRKGREGVSVSLCTVFTPFSIERVGKAN